MRQNYHQYTDEEKAWLVENYNKYSTLDELATAFNEIFGLNVNRSKLNDLCGKRIGLKRNGNRGKYGHGKIKPTAPIGTEREFTGYIWVKVSNEEYKGMTKTQRFYKNWVQKQRLIYEQAYGEIPEGNIVVFLDGNNRNFNENNLYCVSRSIHVQMCKNRWYSSDRDLTLAAIKLCELKAILGANT